MSEEKREAGEIVIEERVRSLLSTLRALEGVSERPELEVEAVRDVERGLNLRLPAEILAVFAARVPLLETGHEMSLLKVIGHTGKVRNRGATGDLVGIGKESATKYLCAEKGASQAEGIRLTVFETEDRSSVRTTLTEWLSAIVEERRRLYQEASAEAPSAEEPFVPALIRRLPTGSPGDQVMHPTFGGGRVLREIGTGPNRKVQVDFHGQGLKLIQARFLQWLE